jgi:hypothetical protein
MLRAHGKQTQTECVIFAHEYEWENETLGGRDVINKYEKPPICQS